MKCQRNECTREAECAIAINVPAKGCPIPEHDPLRMVVGLQLCDICAGEEKAESYLSLPGYKDIFLVAAKGLAPPDFDRAFVTRVDFHSAEWRAMLKARSKR